MSIHICIDMCIDMCVVASVKQALQTMCMRLTIIWPAKVRQWMSDGLRARNANGQLHSAQVVPVFACRWLSDRVVAASGARQALFTFYTPAVAEAGLETASSWWFPVRTDIDARGWRWAAIRWFT